jgi:hypothetical protein
MTMAERMNTPELAVVVTRGGEPGGGGTRSHDFTILRKLEPEEYEKYADARRLVMGFMDDYLKFVMTRRSYDEYVSLLRAYSSKYSSERIRYDVQAMADMQEVNRRLRGFLAEMRSFQDHAIAALKDEYGGDEAPEVQSFLKKRSQIFDDSPSYRFVYKLRDYALHKNIAIQGMTHSTKPDMQTGEARRRLVLHVIRDELLRPGFNWTKHVESYLKELPEQFELDPHIEIMMVHLEKLNVELAATKLPKMKKAAGYINELAASVQEPGDPCVVFGMPRVDPATPNAPPHIQPTIDHMPTYAAVGIENLPEPDELRKLTSLQINFNFQEPDRPDVG